MNPPQVLSPDESLDVLLAYAKQHSTIPILTPNLQLKDKIGIGYTPEQAVVLYHMYIQKLCDDGMIVYEQINGFHPITSKGFFFEGYVNQNNRKNAELINLVNRNARAEQNEINLVRWSRRATIAGYSAAAVALSYLIWDMWKYFHDKTL